VASERAPAPLTNRESWPRHDWDRTPEVPGGLDFQARIARPLRLSDLVAGAARVEAELLGLAEVPAGATP